MYSYVVQILPAEVAEMVCDLVYEIPAENSYNVLNDAIVSSASIRLSQKWKSEVGNHLNASHTWSNFWSHKMDCAILQHLWMQKFPPRIRKVLTFFKEDALTENSTEAADRMFDANPKSEIAVTIPFTMPMDSI